MTPDNRYGTMEASLLSTDSCYDNENIANWSLTYYIMNDRSCLKSQKNVVIGLRMSEYIYPSRFIIIFQYGYVRYTQFAYLWSGNNIIEYTWWRKTTTQEQKTMEHDTGNVENNIT